MRRFINLTVALIFVCLLTGGVFANGLSLNSVGTRALGMGGAFVGLADDATAIYWNPAGLTNVHGGFVGIYVTGISPAAKYSWENPAFGIDVSAETKSNMYIAPNLFASYQTGAWTFGLGVYVPAGLGAEWNGADLVQLSGGDELEWLSEIGVVSISPAAAYKVSDQFSIGLAVDIFYGMFDLKRPADMQVAFAQYSEESTGTGVGVTLGLQYKINEMFTLGGSFKTQKTVKMSGTAKNPGFAMMSAPTESEFDREVSWPMWIAGGVAVKPSECLTITFDVQHSQWSKSSDEFVTEYKDATWRGALEPGDDHKFILKWEDATQIRAGVEFLATDALALRGGYYYDPAPAPDETLNILFPSSTNHVVTGGLSYGFGDWHVVGAAEYLFGQERVVADDFDPLAGFENEMPGKHQMDIFAWSLGVGYAF